MAIDFEKLVNQIMKEAEADGEPVTREEAEEMAEMEIKAKGISNYTQGEKSQNKGRKPITVKVSDEKKELFQSILTNIDRCVGVERENVTVLKENKLIQVKIGKKTFKIDIIQMREPKK